GMSLMRTSYMSIHTDDQLNRVIEQFEILGKKFKVIPEDAPVAADVIDKVGSIDDARTDAPRFVATTYRPAAQNGSVRTTGRLAQRVFDMVESATWRAANFQIPTRDQFNKMVQESLSDMTGAVIERTYKLMELASRARGARRMSYDDE